MLFENIVLSFEVWNLSFFLCLLLTAGWFIANIWDIHPQECDVSDNMHLSNSSCCCSVFLMVPVYHPSQDCWTDNWCLRSKIYFIPRSTHYKSLSNMLEKIQVLYVLIANVSDICIKNECPSFVLRTGRDRP